MSTSTNTTRTLSNGIEVRLENFRPELMTLAQKKVLGSVIRTLRGDDASVGNKGEAIISIMLSTFGVSKHGTAPLFISINACAPGNIVYGGYASLTVGARGGIDTESKYGKATFHPNFPCTDKKMQRVHNSLFMYALRRQQGIDSGNRSSSWARNFKREMAAQEAADAAAEAREAAIDAICEDKGISVEDIPARAYSRRLQNDWKVRDLFVGYALIGAKKNHQTVPALVGHITAYGEDHAVVLHVCTNTRDEKKVSWMVLDFTTVESFTEVSGAEGYAAALKSVTVNDTEVA